MQSRIIAVVNMNEPAWAVHANVISMDRRYNGWRFSVTRNQYTLITRLYELTGLVCA